MITVHNGVFKRIISPLGRIPGAIEAYLGVCDALGRPPGFDSAWRHLPGWLGDLGQARSAPNGAPRRRILFFSDTPSQVDFALAVAILLAGRDVTVNFAWLSHTSLGSQPAMSLGYSYWRRSAQRVASRLTHPRLHLHDLEKTAPSPITPAMRQMAVTQAEMDVSFVLRKERTKNHSDPQDHREFEYRRERNLDAVARIATLLRQHPCDRAVMLNGAILECGVVYDYLHSLGVPSSTYEAPGGGIIVVSSRTKVLSLDTSDLWARDEPHIISESRRARVKRLIESRQVPANGNLEISHVQRAATTPAEQTRVQLGIKPDKRVVLVCPNVPFDTMFYLQSSRCFSAMWEWLVKTVEYLSGCTDCQVIIRSHPGETEFDTGETVGNLLREFFPSLPSHIRVIPPEAPLSTYSIMNIADFGIVYASTTGLEMPVLGLPAVCAVSSHYTDKGFTLDPTNQEEYFDLIDRLLRNVDSFRLSPRQIELAWCYADVFFHQWYKPFPWGIGSMLWRDLKAWPISRMLSPEGEERFGGTINTLIGEA